MADFEKYVSSEPLGDIPQPDKSVEFNAAQQMFGSISDDANKIFNAVEIPIQQKAAQEAALKEGSGFETVPVFNPADAAFNTAGQQISRYLTTTDTAADMQTITQNVESQGLGPKTMSTLQGMLGRYTKGAIESASPNNVGWVQLQSIKSTAAAVKDVQTKLNAYNSVQNRVLYQQQQNTNQATIANLAFQAGNTNDPGVMAQANSVTAQSNQASANSVALKVPAAIATSNIMLNNKTRIEGEMSGQYAGIRAAVGQEMATNISKGLDASAGVNRADNKYLDGVMFNKLLVPATTQAQRSSFLGQLKTGGASTNFHGQVYSQTQAAQAAASAVVQEHTTGKADPSLIQTVINNTKPDYAPLLNKIGEAGASYHQAQYYSQGTVQQMKTAQVTLSKGTSDSDFMLANKNFPADGIQRIDLGAAPIVGRNLEMWKNDPSAALRSTVPAWNDVFTSEINKIQNTDDQTTVSNEYSAPILSKDGSPTLLSTSNAASLQSLMNKQLTYQTAKGIPGSSQQIYPNNVSAQVAVILNNQNLAQTIKDMNTYRANYGGSNGAFVNGLQKNGLNTDVTLAMGAQNNPALQQDIIDMHSSLTKEGSKALAGGFGVDVAQTKTLLATKLTSYHTSLLAGGAQNADIINSNFQKEKNSLTNLSYWLETNKSQTPDDATTEAMKTLNYTYVGSERFPTSVPTITKDPQTGLESIVQTPIASSTKLSSDFRVMKQDIIQNQEKSLESANQGALVKAGNVVNFRNMMNSAQWVTRPNDTGLNFVFSDGTPVLGMDKGVAKPISKSFLEIETPEVQHRLNAIRAATETGPTQIIGSIPGV